MAMVTEHATVTLRVPKSLKAVLDETVRGMNEARQLGEELHSLNTLVTRCVVEVLGLGRTKQTRRARRANVNRTKQATRKPKQLALPGVRRNVAKAVLDGGR